MQNIGRAILNGLVITLLAGAFLFPFIGGAVTAYALIILSLLLIGWNLVRPPRVEFDPGAWMFLISWVLIALAFAMTNLPGRTDFIFAVNFAMFALFPLLSNALRRFGSPGNSRRVAGFALAGTFVALGFCAFQVFALHIPRAHGLSSTPIVSGTVALFLGFFSLLGLFAVTGRARLVYLLGPIAGVSAVLLTGSRGPLLALPALTLVAVAMLPIRRGILVAAIGVAVAVVAGVYVVEPTAFGRIAALPGILTDLAEGRSVPWNTDKSANIRYRILEGSIAAFKESPWLGYGWPRRVPVVEQHIADHGGFGNPLHLHSDILNLGVAAGVVGLLAYLLVLVAPVVSAARAPRDGQYHGRLFVALSLSIGYACCGVVDLLFGFEFMTTMYVCFAAIFIGYCRDEAVEAG